MSTGQISPYQFDMNSMMNNMFSFIFLIMMMKVMLSIVAEPEELELLPGGLPKEYRPLPGARPIPKEQVRKMRRAAARPSAVEERIVGAGMTPTQVESKKLALEEAGRQMAAQANEEFPKRQLRFVELGGDWATRFGAARFWFEDAGGNRIVATDSDELRWKVGVTRK